jgi:hypothetical protein
MATPPRLERHLRALAHPYLSSIDEGSVLPLYSGPAIAMGFFRSLPNVILALSGSDAVLLRTDMFCWRVRKVMWKGVPADLRYKEHLIRYQLVVAGEERNAYAVGSTRDVLERVARRV